MGAECICRSCEHFASVHIKNEPGGSGDRHFVKCLIMPDVFTNLVVGMWYNGYPRVEKCNKWESNR
jgi:hypothetical protein